MAAAPPEAPPQGGYAPGQLGPQPQAYPQQPYAPGAYTPPAGLPGPQGYPPAQPPPQYPAAPPPAAVNDPINDVDLGYLRETARWVLGELVASLPQASQAKVAGIPFVADAKVGDVNAYASCDDSHMPRMSVTDGLLTIEAYIAQLRATDELYGTHKLDAYLDVVATSLKPRQPIPMPPAGLVDPAQHLDARKVVRQHQLMEEQLAFVLGHELGHHYLGHTGCANGKSGDHVPTILDVFEQGVRVGTKLVPMSNHLVELDADNAGVDDLLVTGARRPGYHWNEEGALLTLGFFESLHKRNPESVLASVFNDHPQPAYRLRLVQQEANRFRQSGGAWATPVTMLP